MNNQIFNQTEYAKCFWDYTRGKADAANALSRGRTTETDSYHLPAATADKYETAIAAESAFRGIASVFSSYKRDSDIIAIDSDDIGAFVPEGESIHVVDFSDDFERVNVGRHKLATLLRISSEYVNDAAFDFESYLIKRLSQVFARTEDRAFITGTGVNEPTGILNDAAGAETGVSTGSVSYDDIISLYFSVESKYRKNAVWMMNDATAMALRKLKDETGNYLWNTADNTILGKKVVISEYMPNIAAGAKPVAFGDFSYYWIIKRCPVTVKTLLELFAMRDQIGYLAYEFIDGKLIRRDSVKVLSVTADAE